jgi:solute carrier family 25 (mitochondrial phosphate transporter), member 3
MSTERGMPFSFVSAPTTMIDVRYILNPPLACTKEKPGELCDISLTIEPSEVMEFHHSTIFHGCITLSILTLLMLLPNGHAACAIDQPSVDQAILGVPIPVPDIRYFISGGVCAATSHGITTPVDVIKTRIQAEPATYKGLSLPEAAAKILRQNGTAVLLGGLGPTIAGYGLEGAAKFGLYESLKPVFANLASTAAAGYLGASIVAGAFASLLLCPMEQTRIRLVTDPSFAKGFLPALHRLLREEGWTTILFGGFPAMLSKQVPYTFCKQVSFDVFAASLYSAAYNANLSPISVNAEVPIAAAFLASILACIASHPGDVILTDTYKKGKGIENIPRFSDAVSTLYREEGFGGFFSGITARFLHVGIIITSQLVLYDSIKQLLGLPATGTS